MTKTIPPEDVSQFNVLLKSADDQRTILLRCEDKKTKKMVTLLAVYHVDDDGTHTVFPVARILGKDEFNDYTPPAPSSRDG